MKGKLKKRAGLLSEKQIESLKDKMSNLFSKEDLFTHLKEESFDKNYKLIMLDPIISSPTYGKWYAIVGQNQIIKASGDDFASAKTNIDEFYKRLKNLKK